MYKNILFFLMFISFNLLLNSKSLKATTEETPPQSPKEIILENFTLYAGESVSLNLDDPSQMFVLHFDHHANLQLFKNGKEIWRAIPDQFLNKYENKTIDCMKRSSSKGYISNKENQIKESWCKISFVNGNLIIYHLTDTEIDDQGDGGFVREIPVWSSNISARISPGLALVLSSYANVPTLSIQRRKSLGVHDILWPSHAEERDNEKDRN